jgi:integrase/recombinase XerD
VSRVSPAGGELAGGWLSKFLTSYLAGERDLSPQTIESYWDAIRLLLTWFRDVEGTPPESCGSPTSTGSGCSASWTGSRPNAATRRQPATSASPSSSRSPAAPRSSGRSSSVRPPRSSRSGRRRPRPATWATSPETRSGPSCPNQAGHPARAARHGPAIRALRHRRPRPGNLRLNTADARLARPVVMTLHGKGSKTRRVPLMDPSALLVKDYLSRRTPHSGVGTDADPLFHGPGQARLTRWGVTKILARHVQSLRRRRERSHPTRDHKDPGYAPALGRSQPDLHTRPARPRRRVHNRDLRQSRHGRETQGHRERHTSRSPPSPCPTGRQTRTSSNGSITPADNAPGLCGRNRPVRHSRQRKHPCRPHNPAIHIMPLGMRRDPLGLQGRASAGGGPPPVAAPARELLGGLLGA